MLHNPPPPRIFQPQVFYNHAKYLIPSETFPWNIEILEVEEKFLWKIVLKVFSFGEKLAHKLSLLYSFKDLWRSINQTYQIVCILFNIVNAAADFEIQLV